MVSISGQQMHHMRSFSLQDEEMVVLGEEGSSLAPRPLQLAKGSNGSFWQVLYGITGHATAYFPRPMMLQGKLCLCPDCRADGGAEGFRLLAGELLELNPAEGVAALGPGELLAISTWSRARL